MAIRTPAKIGDERTAPNGYHYIKTESGWRLKHHIIFEQHNGRPVASSAESICFADGDITNFKPDNLISRPRGSGRLKSRIASLESRIADLTAERDYYLRELAKKEQAASS